MAQIRLEKPYDDKNDDFDDIDDRWELCGPFINTCKRLLSSLITAEPKLIRTVADRKKLLTKVKENYSRVHKNITI